MPLNGSGGVTQPTGSLYPAVASTLIESGKANTSIADIYTILASALYKDGQQTATARIPFAAGIQTDTVTEKTSDTGVTLDSVLLKDGRVDTTQGADIVCSATINLETATGNVVDVTGSTGPVTAITLSQGHWRLVRFTSTPTLTNGASLVLPGGANITAAAGDYALFVGYASSVVRCAMYVRAAAAALLYGLTDPNADRLIFWDDSAGANAHLSLDGLTITGTTLAVDAATDTAAGKVELATTAEVQTGTDTSRAVTPAGLQNGKAVNGTPAATTSGTTKDFPIPAWAKQITVCMNGVSLSGTDNFLIQIGDAGGIENTNYIGCTGSYSNAALDGTAALSAGFTIGAGGTGAILNGAVTLTLSNASNNTWTASGVLGNSAGTSMKSVGGYKSLSAALTTVRLAATGVDTFDAGEVNVLYI